VLDTAGSQRRLLKSTIGNRTEVLQMTSPRSLDTLRPSRQRTDYAAPPGSGYFNVRRSYADPIFRARLRAALLNVTHIRRLSRRTGRTRKLQPRKSR
jgi:hypothetical protein